MPEHSAYSHSSGPGVLTDARTGRSYREVEVDLDAGLLIRELVDEDGHHYLLVTELADGV